MTPYPEDDKQNEDSNRNGDPHGKMISAYRSIRFIARILTRLRERRKGSREPAVFLFLPVARGHFHHVF